MDTLPLAERAPDVPPPLPVAEVPMAVLAAPIELEYSRTDAALAGEMVRLFDLLLYVAVLSGLCVGSCFLVMAERTLGSVLHAIVYALILTLAITAGIRMTRSAALVPKLASRARVVLDSVAAAGLVIIGFGPLVWITLYAFLHGGVNPFQGDWQAGVIGVAFLLLTTTTFRHILQYGGLAGVMNALGRPAMAKWLRALGVIKFLYETAWLLCCTAPLLAVGLPRDFRRALGSDDDVLIPLAVGAIFGVAGYAVVWILMIITHARCCLLVRRAAALATPTAAFEVIAAPSPV